jgi:hypothetical protein
MRVSLCKSSATDAEERVDRLECRFCSRIFAWGRRKVRIFFLSESRRALIWDLGRNCEPDRLINPVALHAVKNHVERAVVTCQQIASFTRLFACLRPVEGRKADSHLVASYSLVGCRSVTPLAMSRPANPRSIWMAKPR